MTMYYTFDQLRPEWIYRAVAACARYVHLRNGSSGSIALYDAVHELYLSYAPDTLDDDVDA
jgi:hypothetical protein